MYKCSHPNCDLEVFENNDKCIFHCEKNSWFIINEKNKKNWNEKNVNNFWENIRKYIKFRQNNYQWVYYFDSFIFPDILIDIRYELPINENKVLQKDFYFWRKGDKLEFDKFVSFKNCKFYDFLFYDEVIIDSISFENIKAEIIKLSNTEIKSLYFDKINDKSKIELDNITITENCSFNDLKVDHLSLHDVKFEYITIKTSHFHSAFFSNIRINNGLFISSTVDDIWSSHGFHIVNKDTFTYFNMNIKKANREYFRLMKNYFFDKKDYINGNEMYHKEMDSHLKKTYYLLTNKCEGGFGNFENLIIALFGKYSSNFGQSWLLPLFWIIFTLFLNLYFTSAQNFFDLLKNMPQLLDEMAQLFYIKDKENFRIIDLLFKIPIGLFIYQLTVAIKRKIKY